MSDRDAQTLGLLLLFARASSASSSTTRAPSSAPARTPPRLQPSFQIPGVDVYAEPTEQQLSNPPAGGGSGAAPDDQLWARYAQQGPGPVILLDELAPSVPIKRKLSAFERWALEPYFPQMDYLLETVVHNGETFPLRDVPPNTWALTDPRTREVWVLHHPRPLWSRWWLSLLAHELAHVAQMAMGMTIEEAIEARKKGGYEHSPIEVQARAVQRRVLRGLTFRAREFFRNRETK